MNVVFCGAGRFWQDHKPEFENLRKYTDDKWLGILDADDNKSGNVILGLEVSKTKKYESALYVITSIWADEIKRDLVEKYGIDINSITTFKEYRGGTISREKYRITYGNECCHKDIFNKSNLAVYTCITGDYDVLQNPVNYNQSMDYICFTNNKKLKSDVWDIRYISDEGLDNVHLARYVKLFPHLFLEDYDTSIWADAKYLIRDDLMQYVRMYEKTKDMLCFPHPERDCIYDEAEKCKAIKKGVASDIDRQIKHYKEEGYPAHNGLYDSGCIVRNHKKTQIQEIMRQWWEEIKEYSYRDQLSLSYVLYKNDYLPDICDLYIENNRWLKVVRKPKK
jgi:hypothetical protein